jgi:hypothetical protein
MLEIMPIVCLANPRKFNARCLAGKKFGIVGEGEWIRPISSMTRLGEVSQSECQHMDGYNPNVMDIIEVLLQAGHHPKYGS